MSSIGVNVTRQTVTNTLRRERLRRQRARKTPLLQKNDFCYREKFAVEIYKKKKISISTKFCSQMRRKMDYLTTITIIWFGENRIPPTSRTRTIRTVSMVEGLSWFGVAFHLPAQEIFTSYKELYTLRNTAKFWKIISATPPEDSVWENFECLFYHHGNRSSGSTGTVSLFSSGLACLPTWIK